jgi:hypothetical protein
MYTPHTLEELMYLAGRRPPGAPKLPLPRRPAKRGVRRTK